MPTYKITDPQTGKSFEVTGDSEPSEKEIGEILKEVERAWNNIQETQQPQASLAGQKESVQKNENKEQSSSQQEEDKTFQEQPADISNQDITSEAPAEVIPDVLLKVPTLEINELKLILQGLTARVSLSAQLANLIKLDVGAHADIEKLDLDMKGVNAKAILNVNLKQVNSIFSRALQTIEKHPDILGSIPSDVIQHGTNQLLKSGENGINLGKKVHNVSESPLNPDLSKNKSAVATNEPVFPASAASEKKGALGDSIPGISQEIDRSITGKFDETEEERRFFYRKDKDQPPS